MGDWIRPLRGVMGDQLVRLRETIQQETVFEAVGLPGRSAKLSPQVHHADNLMLRCEMESPWGYGRIVSWYEPPSDAERTAVQDATTEIGWPPANALERKRMRTLLLEHADRLVAANAPMRASIEEARRSWH